MKRHNNGKKVATGLTSRLTGSGKFKKAIHLSGNLCQLRFDKSSTHVCLTEDRILILDKGTPLESGDQSVSIGIF